MASLYRRFQAIFGWLLIAVGLVVLPLPIPLGAIMIVIGIAMVSPSSPMMRDVLRNVRTRFPSFSNTLDGLAPRFPALIRSLIEETRPEAPGVPNPPTTSTSSSDESAKAAGDPKRPLDDTDTSRRP